MKKLLIRFSLFSIPVFLFLLLYIIIDPFKVIRSHDLYLSEYVMLHRGYVSTTLFLRNEPKYHFNSFIFGSSRSCAHMSSEWEKYLPAGDKAFSFGSWDESLEGIYRRIKLIDSTGTDIKNALIIIDTDRTFKESSINKGDHYLISGVHKWEFQFYYLRQYLDFKMILTSIDFSLFHTQRSYMKDFVGMKKEDINPVNNDWVADTDEEIDNNKSYYKDSSIVFYKRPKVQQYCGRQIDEKYLQELKIIKEIFDKHHTRYALLVAPLYDQKKINNKDFVILGQIFGKANVYDYSGINSLTNNKFNYNSDAKHYRHKIGNLLFREIFSRSKNICYLPI